MKKTFAVFSIVLFIGVIAAVCSLIFHIPLQAPFPSAAPASSYMPVPFPSRAPETPSAAPLPSFTPYETEYKINCFAIPNAIMPKLTAADKMAYTAVIRAYFNYETEVRFASFDEIQNLKPLLELCFPIFYNDVDSSSMIIENDRVLWEYSDSKAEHDKNIALFESSVNEYLDYARSVDNEVVKALLIYKLFCSKNYYDYPTENYLKGKTPRPAVMRDRCIDIFLANTGICQCFARGYAFLLNQAGIEAFTACADGGIGHHEWTVVKFNGKWYYADPTWDIGGSRLYYFGMTAEKRTADGYKFKDTKYFAGADFPIADDFSITDTRFKKIYTGRCSGTAYEIDTEKNLVLVYKKDSDGKLHLYEPGTFDIEASRTK